MMNRQYRSQPLASMRASRWRKRIAITQVVAQLSVMGAPLYAADKPTERKGNSVLLEQVAQKVKQIGEAGGAGSLNLPGMVSQEVTGSAKQAAHDWLKRFGTTRLELGTSDDFRLLGGSLDMLLPLWDQENQMFFTQYGVRKKDGKFTGNVGIGYRHFMSGWMFGYNGFYDHSLSRGHQRAGLGVEAWRDYLKLSANGYMRVSNWKASDDLTDYDERPASGFDLRAEGYLPALPSLGGKLMYEQYFGNEVGLFGRDNRQSNPAAVTVGLNYTPIPLVTVGVHHRRGVGQNSTNANIQLTYQLGLPWSKQVDSRLVASRRSLMGSRYDLVERNNDIVLQYRKQQLIKLTLPAEVKGKYPSTMPLQYTVEAKHGLKRIEWQDGALVAAGGAVIDTGGGVYQVRMPAYRAGGNNTYPLSAVAYDIKNTSATASTQVTVSHVGISETNTEVTITPTTVVANGASESVLTVKLSGEDGEAMAGLVGDLTATVTETSAAEVALAEVNTRRQAPALSPFAETEPGTYTATLTAGTRAGEVKVATQMLGTLLKTVTVTQTADADSAQISSNDVTVDKTIVVANGTDSATYRAVVKDAHGNALAGQQVAWQTTLGELDAPNSQTDAHGVATVLLHGEKAGNAQVSAQLNGEVTVNGPVVNLVADAISAKLGEVSVDKTRIVANDTDQATFQTEVKDAQGNVVPEVNVAWRTTHGTLSSVSGATNADGIAIVTLHGTQAGEAIVTAQVGDQTAAAPAVTLTADVSTAQLGSGDVSVDKTSLLANDKEQATFSAMVKDAHGNGVPAQQITWHTDLGVLSGASSMTDADGVATVLLRSSNGQPGTAQVTAQLGTAVVSAPAVSLTFDTESAKVTSLYRRVDSITGTGDEKVTLVATVQNASGKPVPNMTVTWSTSLGDLSSTTSETNENGSASIQFSAISTMPSNQKARLTAVVNASRMPIDVIVRSVMKVGQKYYWTQYSTYSENGSEAKAKELCGAHGGGTAATLADLKAFTAGNGDFARMKVSGEYEVPTYKLAGSWDTSSGDFGSAASHTVGSTHIGSHGKYYVCVK